MGLEEWDTKLRAANSHLKSNLTTKVVWNVCWKHLNNWLESKSHQESYSQESLERRSCQAWADWSQGEEDSSEILGRDDTWEGTLTIWCAMKTWPEICIQDTRGSNWVWFRINSLYMEKISKYVNEMIIIISSSRQTLSQNWNCQNGGLLKVLDFWATWNGLSGWGCITSLVKMEDKRTLQSCTRLKADQNILLTDIVRLLLSRSS